MLPRPRGMTIVAALVATAFGLSTSSSASADTNDPPSPHGAAPASTPSALPASGTFYPTAVLRVLGTATTGYAVSPGAPVTVAATGREGLPSSGVSAVMVNVTVGAGASDTGVSVVAVGGSTPAPLLAVPAGTTRSALLTVPLATAAGFEVSASGGSAAVTADVLGFYAADDTVTAGFGFSGGYQPVETTRLSSPSAATPVPPGGRASVNVTLGAEVTSHVTALLVRVTATDTTAAGSLGVSAPSAATQTGEAPAVLPSSVSFGAGTPASNLALVPAEVDSNGRIGVEVSNASAAPAAFALDLVGFYDDGGIGPNLRFRALPQTRVIDTGAAAGVMSALTPGTPERTTPSEAVVGDSTFALAGVVTASTPGPSALAVFPADSTPAAGQSAPLAPGSTSVAVQPEVGADRDLALLATSGTGPVGLTMDVVGSFEAYPPVTNSASRHWVPPVSPWQISAVTR